MYFLSKLLCNIHQENSQSQLPRHLTNGLLEIKQELRAPRLFLHVDLTCLKFFKLPH